MDGQNGRQISFPQIPYVVEPHRRAHTHTHTHTHTHRHYTSSFTNNHPTPSLGPFHFNTLLTAFQESQFSTHLFHPGSKQSPVLLLAASAPAGNAQQMLSNPTTRKFRTEKKKKKIQTNQDYVGHIILEEYSILPAGNIATNTAQ